LPARPPAITVRFAPRPGEILAFYMSLAVATLLGVGPDFTPVGAVKDVVQECGCAARNQGRVQDGAGCAPLVALDRRDGDRCRRHVRELGRVCANRSATPAIPDDRAVTSRSDPCGIGPSHWPGIGNLVMKSRIAPPCRLRLPVFGPLIIEGRSLVDAIGGRYQWSNSQTPLQSLTKPSARPARRNRPIGRKRRNPQRRRPGEMHRLRRLTQAFRRKARHLLASDQAKPIRIPPTASLRLRALLVRAEQDQRPTAFFRPGAPGSALLQVLPWVMYPPFCCMATAKALDSIFGGTTTPGRGKRRAPTGLELDLGSEFDDPARRDLKIFPGANRIAAHKGIEPFAPDGDPRP
jgi:hypothetical protein